MDTTTDTGRSIDTPDAVGAINKAYTEACQAIPLNSAQEELRYRLAEHILFLARNGEWDGHRLRGLSITAVLGKVPGSGG